MPSYTLDNVVERNQQHGDSFWKPPEDMLDAVAPGDFVKLIFLSPDRHAERMWVEVLLRTENSFRGRLNNEPFYEGFGTSGDPVSFERHHIAQIMTAADARDRK